MFRNRSKSVFPRNWSAASELKSSKTLKYKNAIPGSSTEDASTCPRRLLLCYSYIDSNYIKSRQLSDNHKSTNSILALSYNSYNPQLKKIPVVYFLLTIKINRNSPYTCKGYETMLSQLKS